MEWRTRRKVLISFVVTFVIIVFVGVPVFFVFFTRIPTCFDNIKNGDERGIDCGGKCIIVCKPDVLPLVVKKAEIFKVAEGLYNGVAIIENRNVDAGAFDVPYTFTIIDNAGRKIDERKGKIDIPANISTVIFAGSLRIKNDGSGLISKVEIDSDVEWTKEGPVTPNVEVRMGAIQDELKAPRIDGNIKNLSEEKSSQFSVVAVVSDEDGNPIGVSSTLVDPLSKEASKKIYFSWPQPFMVGNKMCDVNSGRKVSSFLGDVVLVIDRSGSMEYESKNPPEPLTTVKLAAIKFAESMSGGDKGALVTFADEATIDVDILSDHNILVQKIDEVQIMRPTIQNTNFGEGMKKATEILTSDKSESKRKAVVILTDGVATRPLSNTDKNYPENYAKQETDIAKSKEIEIYVIGLGKNVNEDFLKAIASSEKNYYGADRKEELAGIYNSIATSICNKRPAIVKTYVVESK